MTPMELPTPPEEEAAETPDSPSIGEVLALWAVTFLIMMVAAQVAGAVFTRYLPGRKEFFLVECVVIVPALVLVWRRGYDFRTVFRLHPVRPAVLGYSLLVGAGMVVIVNLLDILIRLAVPLPEVVSELEASMADAMTARSLYEWGILFVVVAGLGGLLEEMLFRGLIQGTLERNMDTTRAVLVAALLFAVMHLWPWMLIQILLIGVVVGVLTWKSQSIYPAVAVHVLNNAIAVASTRWDDWPAGVPIVLPIAAVGAVVYGMRKFYQACEEDADDVAWEGEAGG